jgi:uncharacterized protein YceH (UPF0502 family)
MRIHLSPHEARVIGCLIEKEITTPDQYPLSLNALVAACNQRSNRDPVMDLPEAVVRETLNDLIKRHLASEKAGFGSRVPKYVHRLCNTEFGTTQFSDQELGILCVLLLRGPQTPGQLRTRTHRLCQFPDLDAVEATLEGLMKREDGPFVAPLAREDGRREIRYGHLLCGQASDRAPAEVAPTERTTPRSVESRLEHLEQSVSQLRRELEELRHRILPQ